MKKFIKTKRTMTTVANKVELALDKSLSIFTDRPTLKRDNKPNWIEFTIVNEHSNLLTGTEVEVVQEALKPFLDKYFDMYYVFHTTPYYAETIGAWLHAPVINVVISKE